MADGLLVVYKPKGLTSHDVINKIRRVYKIKKCGHSGTLDPMAQGVLLVFMGRALKLLTFIPKEKLDKRYLMRVTLGITTDSYDATGVTVNENENGLSVSQEKISEAVETFRGITQQTPPAFSAIKVAGKKAYEKARSGEDFELASRSVEIEEINVVKDYIKDNKRNLLIRADSSRGTYMRSIAHDLGNKLGCGAHLSFLLRERVGDYVYTDAFPWWKIEKGLNFEDSSSFISIENILDLPKITVTDDGADNIRHGRSIRRIDIVAMEANKNAPMDMLMMFDKTGNILGLYRAGKKESNDKTCALLLPVRVFAENEN